VRLSDNLYFVMLLIYAIYKNEDKEQHNYDKCSFVLGLHLHTNSQEFSELGGS
jgi:hypothetical protein